MRWSALFFVLIMAMVVLIATAAMAEHKVTEDSMLVLFDGFIGSKEIDAISDGDANLLLYRGIAAGAATDTVTVFLRDWMGGRAFKAEWYGWKSIGRVDVNLHGASEVFVMEHE